MCLEIETNNVALSDMSGVTGLELLGQSIVRRSIHSWPRVLVSQMSKIIIVRLVVIKQTLASYNVINQYSFSRSRV